MANDYVSEIQVGNSATPVPVRDEEALHEKRVFTLADLGIASDDLHSYSRHEVLEMMPAGSVLIATHDTNPHGGAVSAPLSYFKDFENETAYTATPGSGGWSKSQNRERIWTGQGIIYGAFVLFKLADSKGSIDYFIELGDVGTDNMDDSAYAFFHGDVSEIFFNLPAY